MDRTEFENLKAKRDRQWAIVRSRLEEIEKIGRYGPQTDSDSSLCKRLALLVELDIKVNAIEEDILYNEPPNPNNER